MDSFHKKNISMKQLYPFLAALVFFSLQPLSAQQIFDFQKEEVITRLKEDIYKLASDEMEGREAGTAGERLAAEYIKMQMQQVGLQPLYGRSFFQEFPFPGEWVWGQSNQLAYLDEEFIHGDDFFTLPGSASAGAFAPFVHVGYGLTSMDEVEGFEDYCDYRLLDDVEGHIFIMEVFLPEALDSLLDVAPIMVMQQKARIAAEKGAVGIVFVNTKSSRPDPPLDLRISRVISEIPLVFAREHVLESFMSDQSGYINLTTDLERKDNTGINVAGYIDNNASSTVVIGGHYDHVGYGAQGSRSPGSNAIHYGADDNASGTAGILEVARYIAGSSLSNHNYLFIAFSAEEKGLIGSRYFTQSDAYDMDRVNYMFNFDMIGRLENNILTMIGTGSSPYWDDLIDQFAPDHFDVRKNPGGRGGSDHTSFYVMDIPVLFFFTGIHDDYHRPEDTPDKINYEGAYEILDFALDLIKELDGRERLAFSSSPAPAVTRTRAQTVTLGLMPDHGFDGEGLRVLAVTENQPAHKAGMENGDVITRINDMDVVEIHSYMEAMGRLNRGQTATIFVIREGQEVTLEVQL